MSQNGRSITSAGHGSSGNGASEGRWFVELGDWGVDTWKSESKRYNPPRPAADLSRKEVISGVGGIAGIDAWREIVVFVGCWLKGVKGESSVPSSMFDTDSWRCLRFFRLEEEKLTGRFGRNMDAESARSSSSSGIAPAG